MTSVAIAKAALPPLLIAGLVFWVARDTPHEAWQGGASTPTMPAARAPDTGAIIQAVQKKKLTGLARRRALLELGSTPSLATLERLRASGLASELIPVETLRECARRNPKETWKFLVGPPSGIQSYGQVVLEQWLAQDPQAPVTALGTCGLFSRQEVVQSLLGFLWSDDPKLAAVVGNHLDLLVNGSPPQIPSDPKSRSLCFERLLALPPGANRDALLTSSGKMWFQDDWLAASNWASGLPPELRSRVQGEFALASLSGQQPVPVAQQAWAAKWISSEAPVADLARLGPAYVTYLAAADSEAALTWADQHLAAGPLSEATGKTLGILFSSNPDAAFDHIDAMPAGSAKSAAINSLVLEWGKSDPAAAMNWWAQLPGGDAGGSMSFFRLASQWTARDPDGFRAFLADPETARMPSGLITQGVANIFQQDRTATLEWISTVPEANRARILTSVFSSWARSDPEKAAARLSSDPDLAVPGTARNVAVPWYEADRSASVSWVASLPEGQNRDQAADRLRERVTADPGLSPVEKKALLAKLP